MAGPLLVRFDATEHFFVSGPKLRAADTEFAEYLGYGSRALSEFSAGLQEEEPTSTELSDLSGSVCVS